jgi:hypothetical protein
MIGAWKVGIEATLAYTPGNAEREREWTDLDQGLPQHVIS